MNEYEKATVMRSSLTVCRIESHLKEEECYIYMDILDKISFVADLEFPFVISTPYFVGLTRVEFWIEFSFFGISSTIGFYEIIAL